MTYERLELGDRLIVYLYGSPSRMETHEELAHIRNFAMDEDYVMQVDRLRDKVYAMTDGEWEGFFHRTREEIGNLIRSIKACMWSAALGGCANADFVPTNNKERSVDFGKNGNAGNLPAGSNSGYFFGHTDADHQEREHDVSGWNPFQ